MLYHNSTISSRTSETAKLIKGQWISLMTLLRFIAFHWWISKSRTSVSKPESSFFHLWRHFRLFKIFFTPFPDLWGRTRNHTYFVEALITPIYSSRACRLYYAPVDFIMFAHRNLRGSLKLGTFAESDMVHSEEPILQKKFKIRGIWDRTTTVFLQEAQCHWLSLGLTGTLRSFLYLLSCWCCPCRFLPGSPAACQLGSRLPDCDSRFSLAYKRN